MFLLVQDQWVCLKSSSWHDNGTAAYLQEDRSLRSASSFGEVRHCWWDTTVYNSLFCLVFLYCAGQIHFSSSIIQIIFCCNQINHNLILILLLKHASFFWLVLPSIISGDTTEANRKNKAGSGITSDNRTDEKKEKIETII